MIIPGASWCDLVTYPDGRVELVSLAGSTVACAQRWTVDAGQPLLYLRAAADGGRRVLALGQGHTDGQAYATIEGGAPFFLGPTHGVFPVLVAGREEGWVCFVQHRPDAYMRIELDADGWEQRRDVLAMPPTSQGFLYVASDGTPITQDAGRGAIRGLALPSPAAGVWAGQSTAAATIALYDSSTGQITPLNTPGGQPPHIVESGGTYYVCSYVDGGAWLSTHRRPFAAVTPPIEPPVNPPPQETPVRLESKHSALIEAFAARFPPPGGDEDALRDHWTPKLVEQFVFSFPGEGWCWKSTSPGSRPSSDVIARQVSGGMWGYDLIPGAGTSGWRLESNPGPIDLRTQAPIRMNPVNHLGAAPPVTPPTQPPVTPPASKPFPVPRWPEDVFLHALTRYINEGLYERDKPVENPEGTRTSSRGGLMWFVPIATEELIADIVANGNTLPTPQRWWALADRVAVKAIDFYRRTAPPEH